jgi:hypothetical protein
MLDPHSGSLVLSPTTCLHPADSLEAVRTLLVAETTELRDLRTGWQWLLVRNVQVDSMYYLLDLGFNQQRLRRVALVVAPIPFAFPVTWDSWSEEAEARSLVRLKQWVRAEVGQQEEFAWGTVSAEYDARSAGSSVSINYRPHL